MLSATLSRTMLPLRQVLVMQTTSLHCSATNYAAAKKTTSAAGGKCCYLSSLIILNSLVDFLPMYFRLW